MLPAHRASVRVLKTIPFPEVQVPAVGYSDYLKLRFCWQQILKPLQPALHQLTSICFHLQPLTGRGKSCTFSHCRSDTDRYVRPFYSRFIEIAYVNERSVIFTEELGCNFHLTIL